MRLEQGTHYTPPCPALNAFSSSPLPPSHHHTGHLGVPRELGCRDGRTGSAARTFGLYSALRARKTISLSSSLHPRLTVETMFLPGPHRHTHGKWDVGSERRQRVRVRATSDARYPGTIRRASATTRAAHISNNGLHLATPIFAILHRCPGVQHKGREGKRRHGGQERNPTRRNARLLTKDRSG